MLRRPLLALALVLAPATALAVKPQLLPTGNTIGGPGVVTIPAGGTTLVLRQSDSTPTDLCITVVQLGPPSTQVVGLIADPGSVTNGSSVSTKGDAVTACRNASNEARVACNSAGPSCKALWRVDRLP